MTYKGNLIIVLVVVLLGVGSFAIWTNSQVDDKQQTEPRVFYIDYKGDEVPDEFKSVLAIDYGDGIIDESINEFGFEKIPVTAVSSDEAPDVFPTEGRSLFGLKKGITDIDEIMDWARKNNQKEVYFYYEEDPPLEQIQSFGVFDLFSISDLLDFVSPEKVWADSMSGPSCSPGNTKPSGFSYSFVFPDTSVADNCPGDGLKPSIKVTFFYSHKDLCHGYPVTNHVNDNIFVNPETSHQTALSSVGCFNQHNSGSPYMCYPTNTTVEMYNGTGTSTCGWNNNNNIWGCAQIGSLSTPRKSNNLKIFMREGKFRSNLWLVRHEIQHNYGWTHGSSVGNCGSHGNTESQKHCCKTSNHKRH